MPATAFATRDADMLIHMLRHYLLRFIIDMLYFVA